eukprot:15443_1
MTSKTKKKTPTKKKKRSKSNTKSPKNNTQSIWKETLNECVAGLTDSLFTQFCLSMCYCLFTQFEITKEYFYSPPHMYWICYFVHVNILNNHIWGNTFRNSVNYVYAKSSQNIIRTIFIIFCQYISIFSGVYIWIQLVQYIFADNPILATQLKHLYVGKYEYPNNLTNDKYFQFIWQSFLFQVMDRIVNGIIVTISPLLKRKTVIFDGSWMQVTFRCLVMHYLIVNSRMGVINNANYGFYANLYHWRWSTLDWACLIIPYVAILTFNIIFSNFRFLHNPTYFAGVSRSKKKKKQ